MDDTSEAQTTINTAEMRYLVDRCQNEDIKANLKQESILKKFKDKFLNCYKHNKAGPRRNDEKDP